MTTSQANQIFDRINEANSFLAFNEIARELSCNRRFAKFVRANGEPEFTTDGIKDKYGVTYYTWIENQADSILRDYFPHYAKFLIEVLAEAKPEVETPKFEEVKDVTPTPNPTPNPTPKTTQMDNQNVTGNMTFELPIMGMITEAAKQLVPELTGDIRKQIEEAAKQLRPNLIQIAGRKDIEVKGTQHKEFKKAMTLLNIHKQLMLVGPTGSGKTYLSEQVAKGLDLSFGHLSCTAGMSEAHITGRMTADGSFVSTEFIEAYENGGVFLFDEVDAADPNVLLIINSAISNGVLSVPNRKDNPRAKRHQDFYCVVAANTFGKGSFEYSGREILDEAFIDRFRGAMIEVNYDTELELSLTKESAVTKRLQGMRGKVDRSISTRTIISAYKMSEAFTEKEVMEMLTIDWTKEERQKAGI